MAMPNMGGPDGEDQMPNQPAPTPKDGEGEMSIFIPKDALGGKTVKDGDKLTLTVKSVDAETGEVEAVCDPASEGYEGESPSMAGFDEAVKE